MNHARKTCPKPFFPLSNKWKPLSAGLQQRCPFFENNCIVCRFLDRRSRRVNSFHRRFQCKRLTGSSLSQGCQSERSADNSCGWRPNQWNEFSVCRFKLGATDCDAWTERCQDSCAVWRIFGVGLTSGVTVQMASKAVQAGASTFSIIGVDQLAGVDCEKKVEKVGPPKTVCLKCYAVFEHKFGHQCLGPQQFTRQTEENLLCRKKRAEIRNLQQQPWANN